MTEILPRARPSRRPRRGTVPSLLRRNVLAVPALGWTLIFFVIPMLLIVLYSFGTMNFLTYTVNFGWNLSNYSALTDATIYDALVRSSVLAVVATVGCLALGFPAAYVISQLSESWQRLALIAVIVPFFTSFIVRTYAWQSILAPGSPLDRALETVGVHAELDNNEFAVAIGIVSSYLPLMILPIYVSLQRIDPALATAAADLGASPTKSFRRVALPLARPGVLSGCILVGVPSMGEYVIPTILGGGKTLMFGNIAASQFLDIGNYPIGSAIAVTFTLVMLAVMFVLRRGMVHR